MKTHVPNRHDSQFRCLGELFPGVDWTRALGYDVELTPHKPKQTASQRGYYWRSLHLFGKYLGYSPGESEKWLHNAILCEAYGVATTKQIGGSVIEIPRQRSHDRPRDEYGDLIETLIRFAAEQGFVIEEARSA